MDGITDAPMRAAQGAIGAFSYAVTEFVRVSVHTLPQKVFRRDIPELAHGALTPTGLPVQVQILGGDPNHMAASAVNAVKAGACGIDLNFGCPAPTVNRNDGGASLLRTPCRIRDIVRAVRDAVPEELPVSAKLRLGWDTIDAIHETAAMAVAGGADWITIHARTRVQGYAPPVYWPAIGKVRATLGVPVVANGDIWTFDDFQRCRDETGCQNFMIGRGALANPHLPHQVAHELGLTTKTEPVATDWVSVLQLLMHWTEHYAGRVPMATVKRLKQWLKLASAFGEFDRFDAVKLATTPDELFAILAEQA